MKTNWRQALETVVRNTGHERFRELCDDAHPEHEFWRREMLKQVAMPPLRTQVKNVLGALGRAAGAAVVGKTVLATDDKIRGRYAICKTCPELVCNRCRLCGCYFEKKIRLETEACPLGKW